MKSLRYALLLPFFQLTVAVTCHIYDAHVYRAGVLRDRAVDNMIYLDQHIPAWPGRVKQGINFPAVVLAWPVDMGVLIYGYNSEFTAFGIYPQDLAFFAGVVLLWGWIGSQIDKRRRPITKKPWPVKISVAGSLSGLVFGAINGVYAVHLLRNEWRPERDVGAFGIFWSLALLGYFIWRLARFRIAAGVAAN
jgi:hypothetical protein